ncbi:probable transporter Seo1p [Diutina catenulata]
MVSTTIVTDAVSRMKWGFIPKRRRVDEDILEEEVTPAIVEPEVEKELDFEYRDEKGRKWYKFFDEYEYRVNKQTKKAKKWYKWFHEDDTPEERRLILKVDFLLTFYSLMAYLIKYLDQANLNSAYIGGLKEGIGMKGNDLVQTQAMFSVGNIVFQLPFIYILYAWPMNYVLPALDLIWAILTVCTYRVTSVAGLKAIRFFIGAAEAPSYMAYHALFASWFKSSTGEGARRAGFYYLGQYLGLLTSGLISGSIEEHLDGKNGLAAWQWIFIVDGIASVFVGIIGFYMIPGTPTDCYSPFLTDDDIRIARKRMKDDGKDAPSQKRANELIFNKETWKNIFSSWHIYVLSLWNIFCWNNNNGTSGAYSLWLKSLRKDDGVTQRFPQGQLQNLTALTPALGLFYLIITSSAADMLSSRWGAILFSQVFNILGNVILAVWSVPEGAKWFAFCLQYFGWAMAPALYSWQGDIMRFDVIQRNISLVVMNIMAQQSTAWTSVLVWKTVEAPRFLKGYSFTACSAFALCCWTFLVLYLYKRQERANARANGIILYNSDDPDSIPSELSSAASSVHEVKIDADDKTSHDNAEAVDEKRALDNTI